MPELEPVSVVGIPQADGSTQWWKLTDTWNLYKTDPAPTEMATDAELAAAIAGHESLPDVHHSETHSHPTHGDINFTGTVSADGSEGLTGQKTIAGYTFTFKKGLLVGFQAP